MRPALQILDGGKLTGRAWLQSLYVKYGSAVHGRCRYLLKDSALAEDAMQDVFARALVNEASFRNVATAVLDRRRLAFDYRARSTDEKTRRTVSPQRLTVMSAS